MREINVSQITDVIEKLCIEANEHLPEDVKCAIKNCRACEDGEIAKGVLDNIIENFEIADNECVPICQDTGMACVFLEIGQDVHIVGGDLSDAVNEGVRRGYDKGYLRKSVVKDPVRRGNTGDNTPAMIYTEIVPGEQIKITVGPKGFGSENMSAIRMFKPSHGLQGIKDFIIETVETAGPNPCPPMVVGVGIGGTFDKAALLAKKALMRPLDSSNPDPFYAELEDEIEEKRIKDNYIFLMKNLVACLKKSDIITLGQFADAMKRAYGEQVLRNADFFSFFVNLCQKDEYQLGGDAGEDTFLDAYLEEGFKDSESFTFVIRKGLDGQVTLSDNCVMADVEFVRKEAHGE